MNESRNVNVAKLTNKVFDLLQSFRGNRKRVDLNLNSGTRIDSYLNVEQGSRRCEHLNYETCTVCEFITRITEPGLLVEIPVDGQNV